MEKQNPYSKPRRIFGVLFIISITLFLILLLIGSSQSLTFGDESNQGEASASNQVVLIGGIVGVGTSCLTSIITFLGFLSTLFLGWRKEARDTKASELERKRLEIELERQKIELGRLKSEEEKKSKRDI